MTKALGFESQLSLRADTDSGEPDQPLIPNESSWISTAKNLSISAHFYA